MGQTLLERPRPANAQHRTCPGDVGASASKFRRQVLPKAMKSLREGLAPSTTGQENVPGIDAVDSAVDGAGQDQATTPTRIVRYGIAARQFAELTERTLRKLSPAD